VRRITVEWHFDLCGYIGNLRLTDGRQSGARDFGFCHPFNTVRFIVLTGPRRADESGVPPTADVSEACRDFRRSRELAAARTKTFSLLDLDQRPAHLGVVRRGGAQEPVSTMICGYFSLSRPSQNNVLELLPPVLHLRPDHDWLETILQRMVGESAIQRPGQEAVLSKCSSSRCCAVGSNRLVRATADG
jgi:cupin